MRLISMPAVLLACSLSVGDAEELPDSGSGMTPHEMCAEVSELAEHFAEQHYAGVPMREVADHYDTNSLSFHIIQGAYDLPEYATEMAEEREITDYGNKVYSQCRDGLQEESRDNP